MHLFLLLIKWQKLGEGGAAKEQFNGKISKKLEIVVNNRVEGYNTIHAKKTGVCMFKIDKVATSDWLLSEDSFIAKQCVKTEPEVEKPEK